MEPDSSTGQAAGVVLVAEDNMVNQMLARGVLEGLGYSVQFADDGLEVVTALTAAPGGFVAVLMDGQLPRLDGYEATRVIRQLEAPGVRVPIIAVTASADPGERARCLAAGMDDHLSKPIDFDLLESTLDRWIVGGDPGADPGAQDAGEVLDLSRVRMLRDLRPGAQSFLDQCVDTFAARAPVDLAAIESAVTDADFTRLFAAAHGLKGSAQNLGAAEVGRLCHALEQAAELGDTAQTTALAVRLPHAVDVALMALQRETATAEA